jgi:hypothetical protein
VDARRGIAALAVLFLTAHLFTLPRTFEDLDSINFAMGVRDFDVARHQPHPPGYPAFIALAKSTTAILHALDVPAADVRGLALWSVAAGAVLLPLLFLLFRALDGDPWRAWWAAGITAASPLFWFTALRPLSDMLGLAVAVAAQALLVQALLSRSHPAPARALVCGAFLAGLAVGVRSQVAVLTCPLLLAALVSPARTITSGRRALALGAAAAGIATWALPLLVATGGPEAYLAALTGQAGEDFAGITMLWTTRSPRAVLDAVAYSFLWPWGGLIAGGIVMALAAAGMIRCGWREPRALAVLALAFGPYAVFHLLFQETMTVRYALPLVPAAAYLVVHALQSMGYRTASAAGTVLVAACLVMAVPAARAYADGGSPTFRLLDDLAELSDDSGFAQPVPKVVGMHAVMRRAQEWAAGVDASFLRAAHGREWLALVEHWREAPHAPAFFIADPRRTDLVLFDRRARQLIEPYRWGLPPVPYLSGARPGDADFYAMRPPGWMLDRGWALTAEVAGVSERDGAQPNLQPSVAWVLGRTSPSLLAIGGRHLGTAADPPSRLTIASDATVLASWIVPPGFFFRVLPLPAGTLAGDGYLPLRVSAAPTAPTDRPLRVALEQFDLQPEGTIMSGFDEGWHEPEYDTRTARAWRWMSERAVFWVRPVGRDVTLTLSGESPLRDFDRAPSVRVSLGGRDLGTFEPAADFMLSVKLPADLLAAADGRVVIDSDRSFSPAARGGSADRRRLALRVYSVGIE